MTLWLVLFFLCLRSHGSYAASFDFHYLAMQWPPAVCNQKISSCYKPIIGYNFTLHGLWPQNYTGELPGLCSGPPFDINELISAGIEKELEKYGPNHLARNTNVKFWKHEWEKHGKCSSWSIVDYFSKAVKRVEDVNILEILESAGIKPNDKIYSLDEIQKAFRKHNLEPQIKCNILKGKEQLYEIRLCVEKTGVKFEQCRIAKSGCGSTDEIIFSSTSSAVATVPAPPPPK